MSEPAVFDTAAMLSTYYEAANGNEMMERYHERHGTQSAAILTVFDDERAAQVADYLRPIVEGKVVVEIGAGIGLLACHVAMDAKRVYAIELDPAWTSTFLAVLYARKPKNLTFIFGAAEDAPPIAADVAYFCTLSGHAAMYQAASRFAPRIVDVYADLLNMKPGDSWPLWRRFSTPITIRSAKYRSKDRKT